MTLETANRLYELRKKHNLSQEELAERLGVSRQAVSKWERGEASPDTDNLIALARIYGLSLDELIYGEKEEKEDNNEERKEENKKEKDSEEKLFVNVEDGNDKIKIGPKGIVVEDSDGDTVKINFSGITVKSSKSDEYDDDDNDNNDNNDNDEPNKSRFWLEVPYPIICVIAYLIFGFADICGGWALSWVVFITIPIYYTLVEAIYKKRFSEFSYPVFTAFVYLVMGLYFGNWHPSWIIFITVPVYYPIAEALDKKIHQSRNENKN